MALGMSDLPNDDEEDGGKDDKGKFARTRYTGGDEGKVDIEFEVGKVGK